MSKIYNYSVALCTYNGEKYIAEQLYSILEQNILPKEIIISDDGSEDDTLEIADNILKKSSVEYKIVRNGSTHGVTANFCNAIRLCSEEIIFTSDQDDVWVKNKAEIILEKFEKNEKALLIFSNGELVDRELKLLNCDMWRSVGISKEMLEGNQWFEYMLKRCIVTGATMAFKKELFSEDEEIPNSWLHDGWLAWKAVARNGLISCEDRLIMYRQHGNNTVGMNSVTSITRMKSYINSFKTICDTHLIRYNRYLELKKYMGYMFTEKENKELNECISFWKELVESDKNNKRLRRLSVIRKHIKNKNFERYFNGSKGAIREMLVAIFF